jgi:hypothetical protein
LLDGRFKVSAAMKGKERGSPEHDELRQLLLESRQRAKLTQRELTARLSWDQKAISKLQVESKRLTVLQLIEIAGFSILTRLRCCGGSPSPGQEPSGDAAQMASYFSYRVAYSGCSAPHPGAAQV